MKPKCSNEREAFIRNFSMLQYSVTKPFMRKFCESGANGIAG